MKVLRTSEDINKTQIEGVALTVGSFDGVHRGHVYLLEELKKLSPQSQRLVITFDPHPAKVLSGRSLPRIFPSEDQVQTFSHFGVDYLYFLPFTKELAALSAEDFAKKYLFELFKPSVILVGYDFAFGKDRTGHYELLQRLAPSYHCRVYQSEAFQWKGRVVSSTRIRESIRNGQVHEANELLDRPFYLMGKVVEGKKLGRTIGVPTANLFAETELFPQTGVYLCKVHLKDHAKPFYSLCNIGTNPTVGGDTQLKIECHILDFHQDIYGQTLKIEFLEKIRDEFKFPSFDELKKQIAKDIQWARAYIINRSKV